MSMMRVRGRPGVPWTLAEAERELRKVELDRCCWQEAAELWKQRYRSLVNEPLLTLLWRRMLGSVARLLGR